MARTLALCLLGTWLQLALVVAHAQERQPQETEAPAPAAEVPQDAEAWLEYVGELKLRISADEVETKEADALYPVLVEQLRTELSANAGAFRNAASSADPVTGRGTIEELYESLERLYLARIALLDLVSPELREVATGTGVEGMRELKLELQWVQRAARYQRLGVPDGLRRVVADLRTAPLPTLSGLLLLAGILFLFRLWRRWASGGLAGLRDMILSVWPDRDPARAAANLLWYLDRIRRPLEWLLILHLVFAITRVPELDELMGIVKVICVWVLLAWFAVSLADAVATRQISTQTSERSAARLRTLWVLASWLGILGLGLHLTGLLAGNGTLRAWNWTLFEILAVPAAIGLILIWRPAVRERLERQARFSPRLRRFVEHDFRPLDAVIGTAYLFALWLGRFVLKLVRKSAVGRNLVAQALRHQMARNSAALATAEDRAVVDPELRLRWLDDETPIESATHTELEKALDLVKRGWPNITIVAERGGGKSAFLRQIVAAHEGQAVLVECPFGGADEAWAALARRLGIEEEHPTPEAVAEAATSQGVDLVVWDDLHRISRPMAGGQREVDRISRWTAPLREKTTLISAIDGAAWRYITRLREGFLVSSATVELSAWTESQIGELIDACAENVGLELDYRLLSLPWMLMEREFATPEQGLVASYRRILWSEADGNPAVAKRLAVDSMIALSDGAVAVQIPHTLPVSEFDQAGLVDLLVLRFIVQADGTRLADIVAGLRFPNSLIQRSLLTARTREWIEEDEDRRLHVTARWFRTITRALARRNLLATSRQRAESPDEEEELGRRRQARGRGRALAQGMWRVHVGAGRGTRR